MEIYWLLLGLALIAGLLVIGIRRTARDPGPVASWRADSDMRANPVFSPGPAFLGYPRATLATIWADAISPDDALRIREVLDRFRLGKCDSINVIYDVAAADGTLHRVATQAERTDNSVQGRHVDLGDPDQRRAGQVETVEQLVATGTLIDRLIEDPDQGERQFRGLIEARRAVDALGITLGVESASNSTSFADVVSQAINGSALRGHACRHELRGGRLADAGEVREILGEVLDFVATHRGSIPLRLGTGLAPVSGHCQGCGMGLVGRWHRLNIGPLGVAPALRPHLLRAGYDEGAGRGSELARAASPDYS